MSLKETIALDDQDDQNGVISTQPLDSSYLSLYSHLSL